MKNEAEYLFDRVLARLGDQPCDREALYLGAREYLKDNFGGSLSEGGQSESIRKMLDRRLEALFCMPEREIAQYFTHYRLMEDMRILENKTLALAEAAQRGDTAPFCANALEEEFEALLQQVQEDPMLYEKLAGRISEIVLNLDSAKGGYGFEGQKLHDRKRAQQSMLRWSTQGGRKQNDL
ncbi:MAG: hypothetical protein IJH70_08390 [Oscillospiraceae bacterium]|nr:hypothetical protein [Oscillospiraceae bacterium]